MVSRLRVILNNITGRHLTILVAPQVSRIIRHPNFKDNTAGLPNDIALIYLSSSANTNSQYISTIALPSQNENFAGNSNCYITGWGTTRGGGSLPNILQVQYMPYRDGLMHWDYVYFALSHRYEPVHMNQWWPSSLTEEWITPSKLIPSHQHF